MKPWMIILGFALLMLMLMSMQATLVKIKNNTDDTAVATAVTAVGPAVQRRIN